MTQTGAPKIVVLVTNKLDAKRRYWVWFLPFGILFWNEKTPQKNQTRPQQHVADFNLRTWNLKSSHKGFKYNCCLRGSCRAEQLVSFCSSLQVLQSFAVMFWWNGVYFSPRVLFLLVFIIDLVGCKHFSRFSIFQEFILSEDYNKMTPALTYQGETWRILFVCGTKSVISHILRQTGSL